jgi:hypothetical protein
LEDVGTRRQAFYTDLSPGTYHFRVQGSNNSGVWNETGASLEFSIAPAYYQTRWFEALILASACVVLWAGYRGRVRQISRDYQRRLDERVNERTRIARELHDTLLQSFHGLLLRFQTVSYLLPDRPADAKETLDTAIDRAAKAITEGRNAVQGLRASTVERNDLAVAIRTLGDELGAGTNVRRPATFDVVVEGQSRESHPIVRDEIYRIAGEALRNAFPARATPIASKWRSTTTGINCGCVCATTARGSMQRWPATAAKDIMAARHAGTGGTDRRHRHGMERSGGRDGGGAARSCESGLRDSDKALLAPTGIFGQIAGAHRGRSVVSDGSSQIRILAVDDHQLVREGIAGFVGVQPI